MQGHLLDLVTRSLSFSRSLLLNTTEGNPNTKHTHTHKRAPIYSKAGKQEQHRLNENYFKKYEQ